MGCWLHARAHMKVGRNCFHQPSKKKGHNHKKTATVLAFTFLVLDEHKDVTRVYLCYILHALLQWSLLLLRECPHVVCCAACAFLMLLLTMYSLHALLQWSLLLRNRMGQVAHGLHTICARFGASLITVFSLL